MQSSLCPVAFHPHSARGPTLTGPARRHLVARSVLHTHGPAAAIPQHSPREPLSWRGLLSMPAIYWKGLSSYQLGPNKPRVILMGLQWRSVRGLSIEAQWPPSACTQCQQVDSVFSLILLKPWKPEPAFYLLPRNATVGLGPSPTITRGHTTYPGSLESHMYPQCLFTQTVWIPQGRPSKDKLCMVKQWIRK